MEVGERGKGDRKGEKVKEQVQGASLASKVLSQLEWGRWVTRSRPHYALSVRTAGSTVLHPRFKTT